MRQDLVRTSAPIGIASMIWKRAISPFLVKKVLIRSLTEGSFANYPSLRVISWRISIASYVSASGMWSSGRERLSDDILLWLFIVFDKEKLEEFILERIASVATLNWVVNLSIATTISLFWVIALEVWGHWVMLRSPDLAADRCLDVWEELVWRCENPVPLIFKRF